MKIHPSIECTVQVDESLIYTRKSCELRAAEMFDSKRGSFNVVEISGVELGTSGPNATNLHIELRADTLCVSGAYKKERVGLLQIHR